MRRFLVTALLAATALHAGLIHSYTFDGNANDQTGSENGTLTAWGATIAAGFLTLDGTGGADFATHIIPASGT